MPPVDPLAREQVQELPRILMSVDDDASCGFRVRQTTRNQIFVGLGRVTSTAQTDWEVGPHALIRG